jgi:tetratricopeptide (TPR) repeat protein
MTLSQPPPAPWLRRPELWVFLIALALRLLVLSRFSETPYFVEQKGDMKFYAAWADRILAGHYTDGYAFYGLPGYAFLLAGIFKITGPEWPVRAYTVGILQAICEALTAVLIFKFARRICASEKSGPSVAEASGRPPFDPLVVAALAALAWITFVPAQAFSAILMPTSWVVCIYWYCVWESARARETSVWLPWLPLGVLVGVTCMLVATITFAAALLLARLILSVARFRPWPERAPRVLLAAAVFVGGMFAGASPAWIHNYFVAKDPVLLSAHSGLNFWMGNSPGANGYPKIPEGLRPSQEGLLQDSILWAEKAAGHPLKRSEVSHYWSDKAQAYISTHRPEWFHLLTVKIRNFWNAFQYDDISVITLMQERGVLWPGLRWGFIAALGLAGMLFVWRRNPPARWVAAAVLLHMMAIMPVFITERYRLAAAPGLILLAAYGLWRLWRALVAADWLTASAYAAISLAAALFTSLPTTDPAFWALDQFNVGVKELDLAESLPLQGATAEEKAANSQAAAAELDHARRHLQRAYALVQNNPGVLLALGNLAVDENDQPKAEQYYQKALALNPADASALKNLGYVELGSGQWNRAEKLFTAALQSSPDDANTYYLLAQARSAQGHLPAARSALAEALKRKPNQPEFLELEKKLTTDDTYSPGHQLP